MSGVTPQPHESMLRAAPPKRPTSAMPYESALCSLETGDSFTIPKNDMLRTNLRSMARYRRISIITRTLNANEIRVWRIEEPQTAVASQIQISKNVAPPRKPTDIIEVVKLRVEKEKAAKARKAATQKIQLVDNDRHSITLVVVNKPAPATV